MAGFFVNAFSEDIFRQKYLGNASDVSSYFNRLAGLISMGDDVLKSRFYDMMIQRRFSPGGRILAFAGRPQSKLSLMNCTTHAVEEDSLESINDTAMTIMRASSRGQGIGVDVSRIRPKDSPVDNAARTSTGAISFMELFNHVGGTIGQEGRRAAMLFSIADTHPDLWRPEDDYDFLNVKRHHKKIENANISVRVSDALMNAVNTNTLWSLHYSGISGSEKFTVDRKIRADDLFNQFVRSAHASAEPGILYWDTSKSMSNSDLFGEEWEIRGVNACSEEVLDQDGVCNLGSLNLSAYVLDPFTKNARFNFETFVRDVGDAIEFLDNVVTVEIANGNYISKRQLKSLKYLRRVGLGVMGLADMLAMLLIPYGSQKSISQTDVVMRTLSLTAYIKSIELAKKKGPALAWNSAGDYWSSIINGGFFKTLPADIRSGMNKYGTRNITLLSIAPTGSISNLFGVSSGIEPIFAHSYTRRTRIHGYDTFVDYTHPGVVVSRSLGLLDSLWPTAYDVTPSEHISLQSVAQKYVDASIAKTVNLPSRASVADVRDVYLQGWRSGLKGMTVYRDGSRDTQILYVESGQDDSDKCPVCNSELIVDSGCKTCPSCTYSVCSI